MQPKKREINLFKKNNRLQKLKKAKKILNYLDFICFNEKQSV